MLKELFYYNANGMWLIVQSMAGKCSVSDFPVCPLLKKHNLEHPGSITCYCCLAFSPSHSPKNQKDLYSLCLCGKQVWSPSLWKRAKKLPGLLQLHCGNPKTSILLHPLCGTACRDRLRRIFGYIFILCSLVGVPLESPICSCLDWSDSVFLKL